ncbi:MAG: ATP synthase F1 subunit delta [Selenomonadaceae bacterium]|nr:ATP synthase F1 subunit delta [Selenomonadaceae bacterium]
MLNIQLATKYSRAIFELAQDENKLDDYAEDLKKIYEDVFSLPEAVKFFQNPLVPHQAKKDLLKKAFDKEISADVMNFLMLLVDKSRIGIFNEIYEIFTSLKNQAQGILVADVVTAFPLTKSQESQLTKKLATVTGKKIQIRKHEDKSILGGVIVTIGDKRIDGSAAGRLRSLKSTLAVGN